MASVLFSTIGQAVGGPFGGALGALLGGTIDRSLFGPRRQRQRDLFEQRSAYGETIPRVFGRARQAGILIWGQPMQRSRSGGKGGDPARRGYTASFALALSSGPILEVGRIWADGREFRGSDGRFASPVEMRVHRGLANQPPDPLIVAAEGAGRAPAYRGLAYVVFENLALAEFGNRIPNFSFEIVADEDPPEQWLGELVRQADCEVGTVAAPGTLGFIADQPRWRDSAETLAAWLGAEPAYPGGRLRLGGAPRVLTIPASDLGAAPATGTPPAPPERSIATDRRPAAWSVSHFDPVRDYQRGLQTEWRPREGREEGLDGPFVATAEAARTVAATRMRRSEAGAETLECALPMRWMFVSVGDVVQVEGFPGRWRVVRRVIEAMVVTLTCEALAAAGPAGGLPADPGRSLPSPVVPAGPTTILALEPPVDPWDPATRPELIVAGGGGPGWSGANILFEGAGGAEPALLGSLPDGRWVGHLAAPLAGGPTDIWDERNTLLVELAGDADGPLSHTSEAVLAGANLLLVGEELLQFRTATPEGSNRYRLSGLLRGRGCTPVPPSGHPPGTVVGLLEPSGVVRRPIGVDEERRAAVLLAEGRGDPPGGTALPIALTAAGHAPLAPCHLRAERLPNGDLRFSWRARSRGWFPWGPDTLADAAAFACRIGGQADVTKTVEGQTLLWTAAEQVAATGSEVRSGSLQVIAIGPGPEPVRASPVLSFAF
jgi:hypothetical protein